MNKNKIQKEILNDLKPNSTGRLLLAPRVGKTKLIIDLIKRDKPKSILWVTPSAKLAKKDIPEEFKKWKGTKYLNFLKTITWASLKKEIGEYDLIVLDEEQFITEINAENLLNKKLKGSIISMTGTPTKHENKLKIYERLKLKVLYKLDIHNAVDMGLLANYNINVINIDLDKKINYEVKLKNKSFVTSEHKNYEYHSSLVKSSFLQKRKDLKFRILNRMFLIKNSPSKLEKAKKLLKNLKGRKLIFCSNIKQAESLCEYNYHNKTNKKDLEAFQNEEIDILSLVNSGGVGFTYKNLDHLIITQVDSDKNGLTSQKICRALLNQKNYEAKIWVLCLLGTKDEDWVNKMLENFDENKIIYQ